VYLGIGAQSDALFAHGWIVDGSFFYLLPSLSCLFCIMALLVSKEVVGWRTRKSKVAGVHEGSLEEILCLDIEHGRSNSRM
jgi:hypothetical protein